MSPTGGLFSHTAIAILAVALASAASAAKTAKNDAAAIPSARIPIMQVVASERHAHDRAVRANYEPTKDGLYVRRRRSSGANLFDAKLDAEQGAVISSDVDKSDGDHGRDEKD